LTFFFHDTRSQPFRLKSSLPLMMTSSHPSNPILGLIRVSPPPPVPNKNLGELQSHLTGRGFGSRFFLRIFRLGQKVSKGTSRSPAAPCGLSVNRNLFSLSFLRCQIFYPRQYILSPTVSFCFCKCVKFTFCVFLSPPTGSRPPGHIWSLSSSFLEVDWPFDLCDCFFGCFFLVRRRPPSHNVMVATGQIICDIYYRAIIAATCPPARRKRLIFGQLPPFG